MKKTAIIKKILVHTGIIVFLLVNLYPLIIAFSSSLRSPGNSTSALRMFTELSLESYRAAFERMKFLIAFKNSLLYTGIAIIFIIIFSSMAAYPLSRITSRFSKFLSVFILAGLIIPGQLILIPIVQIFNMMHVTNRQLAPVVLYITFSIPFSVFLYTSFIRTSVPVELEEAAYIDGAGVIRRFRTIVFPLLIPATVAVTITQTVWIWNDFFLSMIFISKSSQTPLPLAMLGFMGDRVNPTQWNILFAACFLCAFPLLLAFGVLQKYFMSGLTVGAVKG